MYSVCIEMLLVLFVCALTATGCKLKILSMEQNMKVLSITDDLEIDNDLEHTLGYEDELNIVQLNIRGLISKQTSLIQETVSKNPNKKIDIFILCETWLNENNNCMINVPNYPYIGNYRRNKKEGGVGILIHNTLSYKDRKDLELSHTSDLESIFVETKTKQGSLIIGSLYRPPHTKEKQFLTDYNLLLGKMKREKDKDILIGMDHNMDLLKAAKNKHTQSFLDYNLEEDLLPTITKPTRISKNCATLLDNIFISRRLQCSFESGIIIIDLSVHLPTLLSPKDIRHETKLQRTITFRKINKETIQRMNDELNSYNRNELVDKIKHRGFI